ncbi:MAG: GNAT family N-acetyltransferase [Actinobacteria bacterium]|nr:GNAT family N-acetyltransferase [Actinomycetota bacterium]
MPHVLPTVEEFYRAMGRMIVRFYGRTPGSRCVLTPHAILGCSGLGSVFLNCGVVFGDGPGDRDPAERRLREFVALIRERDVGGYVCLSERIQQRLEPLARELGLQPLPPVPLMARTPPDDDGTGSPLIPVAGPEGEPEEGRVLGLVTSEESLAQFLAVSEAAFDLPPGLYAQVVTPDLLLDPAVRIYLLRVDGRAVACVCMVEDDGLVGVTGMATLPELQGRGIGGSLLAAVLREYASRVRAFYLTASEAGQVLYRRHGFSVVDSATAWVVLP